MSHKVLWDLEGNVARSREEKYLKEYTIKKKGKERERERNRGKGITHIYPPSSDVHPRTSKKMSVLGRVGGLEYSASRGAVEGGECPTSFDFGGCEGDVGEVALIYLVMEGGVVGRQCLERGDYGVVGEIGTVE
jgi:hypothetical protein